MESLVEPAPQSPGGSNATRTRGGAFEYQIGQDIPGDVIERKSPIPGNSYDTLVRKTRYQIFPFEGEFRYIPMGALEPRGDYLLHVTGKGFSYLRDSLVVFEKNIYWVPVEDIKRGIVRRSRKLELKSGKISYEDFINGNLKSPPPVGTVAGNGTSSNTPGTNPGTVDNTSLSDLTLASVSGGPVSSDQLATMLGASVAELEAIDVAFKNQERALLDHLHREEFVFQTEEEGDDE